MAAAPLVVVVGPTGSGKTALAVKLAEQFGGEIICADSRTVYRGMDIGTAKPTADERARVPHWGLDLVEPGQRFTAADFQKYAYEKIADIREKGSVPLLVGGTGLYVDGVLFRYHYGQINDVEKRTELEKCSLDELHNLCIKSNIPLPENIKNKRYVIRAIEQNGLNNRRDSHPLPNTIIVGIATESDQLRARIEQRSEQLFVNGVVDEAIMLGKKYGWDSEAMTGNVYPLIRRYIYNELTLDEVKSQFVALDWRLAKRQLTWFRRNRFIEWLPLDEAEGYLTTTLEKWRQS